VKKVVEGMRAVMRKHLGEGGMTKYEEQPSEKIIFSVSSQIALVRKSIVWNGEVFGASDVLDEGKENGLKEQTNKKKKNLLAGEYGGGSE
jgi:hypothetical protein